jgi:hypothetical protein
MPIAGGSAKKTVWLYFIAAIVSLIGLGDAIFLTIQDLTGRKFALHDNLWMLRSPQQ